MFFVRFARVCSRHEQARTPSDDESSENFPKAVVPVGFPFSALTRLLPLDRSRVGARGLLARNRPGLLLILFWRGAWEASDIFSSSFRVLLFSVSLCFVDVCALCPWSPHASVLRER